MALPEITRLPDWTGAIIIRDGAVLLLRNLAHQGIYYVLPGGPVHTGESIEVACIRCGVHSMREAARELASQLGADLSEIDLGLYIVGKAGSHPWNAGTTFHYFLVAGNESSLRSDPWIHPDFNPVERKRGVWMPYEWVPAESLLSLNVHPPEAAGICRQILDRDWNTDFH